MKEKFKKFKEFKVQRLKIFFLHATRYTLHAGVFLLFTIHCSLFTAAEAKVYVDITSPEVKKLPIAIQEFNGKEGKNIADIIKEDLDFTGFFLCLDRAMYIESSLQAFNSKNWTVVGAEAVVKGNVNGEQNLIVTASFYDVFESRELFKKSTREKKVR